MAPVEHRPGEVREPSNIADLGGAGHFEPSLDTARDWSRRKVAGVAVVLGAFVAPIALMSGRPGGEIIIGVAIAILLMTGAFAYVGIRNRRRIRDLYGQTSARLVVSAALQNHKAVNYRPPRWRVDPALRTWGYLPGFLLVEADCLRWVPGWFAQRRADELRLPFGEMLRLEISDPTIFKSVWIRVFLGDGRTIDLLAEEPRKLRAILQRTPLRVLSEVAPWAGQR